MSTMTPERWRQVKAVVAGAMDAPPAERGTFLDGACGRDSALRQEVESLLAAVERSDALLDAAAGDDALRARLEAALGDRYEVVRPLGRGGMGAVYLVRDRRHDRPVALKVLLPEVAAALGDTAGAERFLREIRIAARLNHPHVLALHDSGRAGGLLYYTMPYVPGESLRERLRRERRLPLGEALAIAGQVAAALAYAHREGVVHRDVKPENILLREGEAFVADFGIARAVGAAADERLTATGLAVGTPVYMSPEQAAGDGAVDGRSDVYSLGCVLFEMLAGEPPFTGASASAVLARKLTQEPPPLAALRDGVTPALDAAVGRALRRARADRFASAEELARALEQAMGPTAPDSGRTRWAVGVRARRGELVATVLMAITLAATVLVVALSGGREPPASASPVPAVRALAVLPVEADSPHATVADGIHARLTDELSHVSALRVTGAVSSRRYRGTTKPPTAIARELGVDALLASAVTPAGDSLAVHVRLVGADAGEQVWAREFSADARRLERLQKEVAGALVDDLRLPLTPQERRRLARARAADPRASEAYQRGLRMIASFDPDRFRKGVATLEEAIRLDPDDPAPYVALAEAYQSVVGAGHDSMPPAVAFRRARELIERALRLDPDDAEAHAIRAGILYMWDWDWAGAEREFALALRINPASARAHFQYGAYLRTMGARDSAVAELHRARRGDPLSTITLAELALAHVWAGRPDSGVRWARAAADLEPNSAPVQWALGAAFMAKGQHDSSIAHHRRAAELNPRFRVRLAEAYAAAGRRAELARVLAALPAQARGWALLGVLARDDPAAAVRELELAVREHRPMISWQRGDPRLEPLASDARYQALLRRLGLPPRPRR